MVIELFIIGERLNTSISEISKAVKSKDGDYIIKEARAQIEAGANAVDINAGTHGKSEKDDALWMLETVQDAMDVRVSIDSSNPKVISRGINKYRASGRPIINSINGEAKRLSELKELLKDHDSEVIALAIDDNGIPDNPQGRFEILSRVVKELQDSEIDPNRVFLDPLVFPISTDTTKALVTIETLRTLKRNFPNSRTIVGLSNISFGLPKAKLLNITFLTMLLANGLDAAIMDPTARGMMPTVRAAMVLLNRDEYCGEYIAASRAGKLE